MHTLISWIMYAAIVSAVCFAEGFGPPPLVNWKNDLVEAIRSTNPMIGKELIIAARHRGEYQRTVCKIRTPPYQEHQSIYEVIDRLVYDETFQVVDGVEAWDDGGDESVCGIKIKSMERIHDESSDPAARGWVIFMRFKQGGILGQKKLNSIGLDIHLKDDVMKSRLEPRFGLVPEHYDLSLIPNLTSTDPVPYFQGKVKIRMRIITHSPRFIPVHMNHLEIQSLNFTIRRHNSFSTLPEVLELQTIFFSFQEDLVVFVLDKIPLNIGDTVVSEIGFEAHKNTNPFGFYREHCQRNSDKYCWFTQFEPNDARKAFPCHDDPGAKAIFDVKVARTKGWKTLGNMPILRSKPVAGMEGWIWDIFQTTPKMSPYLVAIAIQDYGFVSGAENVTIWATQEYIDAGYAELARIEAPKMISFLETSFGVKYLVPKMDMVSVPNFYWGGMENWGLIFYQFGTLLYDESKPDIGAKWRVLNTIAHELAHQWFGNLVTTQWWDQLWLNEGFATYLSYLVVAKLDPTMNSWARFLVDKINVMYGDATNSSWAISNPVVSKKDIFHRKFGPITYSKGGNLVRMMESYLGLETLIRGLSQYLKEMTFTSTVEEELFTYLEAAGRKDGKWPQPGVKSLIETMKTWTQQPGFPLVTVRRITKNNKTMVELSQAEYGVTERTKQLWDIPITIANIAEKNTDWDDTTPDVWLTGFKIEIETKEDIIPLVNKKAMGYYRVNYSTDIWKMIEKVLKKNHHAIHPLNRAQIICDISILYREGYVDKATSRSVLSYFDSERDSAPTYAYDYCVSYEEKQAIHMLE